MSSKPVVPLRRQATPPPPGAPALCPYLLSYGKKLVKERGMPAEDARQISLALGEMRARSGRCGHGVSVYVTFWGYGDVRSRNTLLRGLRYALRPRVVFASHKKDRVRDPAAPRGTYFEGVVFFQPNITSLDELEALDHNPNRIDTPINDLATAEIPLPLVASLCLGAPVYRSNATFLLDHSHLLG